MGKNKKFEQLTKYITLFEKDSFGEWQGGDTNDGVLTIPYVSYTGTVLDFIHDLHDFAKNNEQYEMRHYREVLRQKGINNLFVAGKIISTTFFAQASIRIIPNCLSMGESLGKFLAQQT